MSEISPLEFLIIKSKSEQAQIEILDAFAKERKGDVATAQKLRSPAEEKFGNYIRKCATNMFGPGFPDDYT